MEDATALYNLIEGISETDRVYDEERIRLEQAALKEAAYQFAEQQINEANIALTVKELILEKKVVEIDWAIAQQNYQQEVARFQNVLGRTIKAANDWFKSKYFERTSPWTDPSFRLIRDKTAIQADQVFDLALEDVYKAMKALIYFTNTRDITFNTNLQISRPEELFQVRTASDLQLALTDLNQFYINWREIYGLEPPSQRQTTISLRDFFGRETNQEFHDFLNDPSNRDDNGNLNLELSTSLLNQNQVFSSNVFNDQIINIQIRVSGNSLNTDKVLIYLSQEGPSYLRTKDARPQAGSDDINIYNLERAGAWVSSSTLNPGDPNDLPSEIRLNNQLATRSVSSRWRLYLPITGEEPDNINISIGLPPDQAFDRINDIEIIIRHQNYNIPR